jgi:hypothetical protein
VVACQNAFISRNEIASFTTDQMITGRPTRKTNARAMPV